MRSFCGSEFLLRAFLSTLLAAAPLAGPAPSVAGDPTSAQPGSDENRQAEPGALSLPDNICRALAIGAAANDLPFEFFARLIWQESRFRPEAVSRAGAQGVAQFMPGTARLRAVADPFDPFEAIAKSAELLRDLNREFGNLGLAAAAYNAGPGRVRDWMGGRRPLPGETQAYVRLVTGRSAEEWAAGQKVLGELPVASGMPCSQAAALSAQPISQAAPPKVEKPPPWGVELVGGPTRAKALEAYQKLQLKYAAILAGREPHVVIRGVIGDMGSVRVRVGAATRGEGNKLCGDLRAVGWYCDVLRN
jgi:hypothetical protein